MERRLDRMYETFRQLLEVWTHSDCSAQVRPCVVKILFAQVYPALQFYPHCMQMNVIENDFQVQVTDKTLCVM